MSIPPSTIFFWELLFLFFLSRQVTRSLSASFHSLTQSKRSVIFFLAFLFLPGTIIHELAHFFMAKILLVRTGAISLLPHLSGDTLRLGSVQIEQLDPVRKLLIGVAPILAGIGILSGIYFYFLQENLLQWIVVLPIFATFIIGNTMFSSKKDIEGTVGLIILLIIGVGVLFWTNPIFFHIFLHFLTVTAAPFFTPLSFYLLPPLILDICIILLLRLLQR